VGKNAARKPLLTLTGQTRIIDDTRVKSELIGNGLGALALSARRRAPMQPSPIAIFAAKLGRFAGRAFAELKKRAKEP
jgi:hypothetical protein